MPGNGLIKKSLIPAYIFSFVIFIIASLSGNELDRIQKSPETKWFQIALSDPFMHFIVFGVLAFLIYGGLYTSSRRNVSLVRVAFLACGYGLFIEVYQAIIPWRSFGIDDIIWNMAGVIFISAMIKLAKLVNPQILFRFSRR